MNNGRWEKRNRKPLDKHSGEYESRRRLEGVNLISDAESEVSS